MYEVGETGAFCMANNCMRTAVRDLATWPLCRRCGFAKDDCARRWGGQQHDPGTHARKEMLGGSNS